MKASGHIKMDPARSVIELFSTKDASGCAIIAQSLGISYSSVYRWQMPKAYKRGLNGRIPGQHFNALRCLAAARKKRLTWSALTGAAMEGACHG